MGKRYDWQVTPQNTPRFSERRALFLVAIGMFVLNLILAGVFLATNMAWFLVCAFVIVAFAAAQCFDMRREMWTWGYVISWIVFSFVVSVALLLWYKAYWWFIGYGIELIIFIFFSKQKLRKKSAKSRRNGIMDSN